jgi:hypothetical protein
MLYREFDANIIYAAFSHKKFCDFQHWKDEATKGTSLLDQWIAAHPVKQKGESLPVDAEIYRALKECLKSYFQGKCAYCESEFDTVAWGDVEHFRPKRGVAGETHPGYYWLSYSEPNLMPSCQKCNQGEGKRNHFPILGKRATCPQDDLSAEFPVLLNPYEKDDCAEYERHFKYIFVESGWDLDPTGQIEGVTERGKRSIELYDLKRESLKKRRRKNQVAAVNTSGLHCSIPSRNTRRQCEPLAGGGWTCM